MPIIGGHKNVLDTRLLDTVFPLATGNRLLPCVCEFRLLAAYCVSLSWMLWSFLPKGSSYTWQALQSGVIPISTVLHLVQFNRIAS